MLSNILHKLELPFYCIYVAYGLQDSTTVYSISPFKDAAETKLKEEYPQATHFRTVQYARTTFQPKY